MWPSVRVCSLRPPLPPVLKTHRNPQREQGTCVFRETRVLRAVPSLTPRVTFATADGTMTDRFSPQAPRTSRRRHRSGARRGSPLPLIWQLPDLTQWNVAPAETASSRLAERSTSRHDEEIVAERTRRVDAGGGVPAAHFPRAASGPSVDPADEMKPTPWGGPFAGDVKPAQIAMQAIRKASPWLGWASGAAAMILLTYVVLVGVPGRHSADPDVAGGSEKAGSASAGAAESPGSTPAVETKTRLAQRTPAPPEISVSIPAKSPPPTAQKTPRDAEAVVESRQPWNRETGGAGALPARPPAGRPSAMAPEFAAKALTPQPARPQPAGPQPAVGSPIDARHVFDSVFENPPDEPTPNPYFEQPARDERGLTIPNRDEFYDPGASTGRPAANLTSQDPERIARRETPPPAAPRLHGTIESVSPRTRDESFRPSPY